MSYWYALLLGCAVIIVGLHVYQHRYRRKARAMILRGKGMDPLYPLTDDEQQFFVAAAAIILPRFGFGGQIPVNTQAFISFGSIAAAVAAVLAHRFWFAAAFVGVALFGLRSLSFYGRNEALNRRRAALLYVVSKKRSDVDELEMGVIEHMYADVLDFAEMMAVGSIPTLSDPQKPA